MSSEQLLPTPPAAAMKSATAPRVKPNVPAQPSLFFFFLFFFSFFLFFLFLDGAAVAHRGRQSKSWKITTSWDATLDGAFSAASKRDVAI